MTVVVWKTVKIHGEQLARVLAKRDHTRPRRVIRGSVMRRAKKDRRIPDFPSGRRHQYRTVWISDVHLGTRGCRARWLLDFLRHVDAEKLYLVGDIIDGWRLHENWYWPQGHNDVVQEILDKAQAGTEVIYIPGNHDEMLRDFVPHQIGGIDLVEHVTHEMVDGRRFHVFHGDRFDVVIRHANWMRMAGDHAVHATVWLGDRLSAVRRKFGYSHWSLSGFLKTKVKTALESVTRFEQAVAHEYAEHDFDGVICGHIHHAEMREIEGITYCNTGDWVESCTALVEHSDGRLELLDWTRELAGRSEQPTHTRTAEPV